jgi:hypothetical protein
MNFVLILIKTTEEHHVISDDLIEKKGKTRLRVGQEITARLSFCSRPESSIIVHIGSNIECWRALDKILDQQTAIISDDHAGPVKKKQRKHNKNDIEELCYSSSEDENNNKSEVDDLKTQIQQFEIENQKLRDEVQTLIEERNYFSDKCNEFQKNTTSDSVILLKMDKKLDKIVETVNCFAFIHLHLF